MTVNRKMNKTSLSFSTAGEGENVSLNKPSIPEHGGNIYCAARELGISEKVIIDFSASINPLGISDKVRSVIARETGNLANYPDPDADMLRQFISSHLDIDRDSIICGNGSTELIYLVPSALKPKKVLMTAPTFSEYKRAVTRAEGAHISSEPSEGNGRPGDQRIKELILKKEDRFMLEPDQFISCMRGCDMAFLCNPNNPTGSILKKDVVLWIARAAKQHNCFLVVDEAFIDFRPDESLIRDVRNNPYLIVLRSLTKYHALAGLRIGYGVFHGDVAGGIREFKQPWTVNMLAQHAAVAAMGDDAYIRSTTSMMRREKRFLENALRDLGIMFFPSAVNFYLITLRAARDVYSRLKKKGMLVRDCSNFRGLDGSYLRVAVRSRPENRRLIQEISVICRK